MGTRPYMKSGSRRKPFPQKGRGKARQGFRYASGMKGGGKPHAHVPKDFRYFLPEKVKLQGMRSVLSAKLAEGAVIRKNENC